MGAGAGSSESTVGAADGEGAGDCSATTAETAAAFGSPASPFAPVKTGLGAGEVDVGAVHANGTHLDDPVLPDVESSGLRVQDHGFERDQWGRGARCHP